MNTSNPVGGIKRREKEKVSVTPKENITPTSTIEYEGRGSFRLALFALHNSHPNNAMCEKVAHVIACPG